ncbi:MAG: hypothetical protein QOI83_13, partial [Streptomycetaceae bacterium]|nr:hypothetical protein [Streptomycetaceae bacterium]
LGGHDSPGSEQQPHPWHSLYYGDNYARLEHAKSLWDPRQVFRHAQSVSPQL